MMTCREFVEFLMAYDEGDWASVGFPAPESLGLRTAESLRYERTGRLGSHADYESVFSISIALSEKEDYTGGFFQLESDDALFKVPRLSAIVFFSETFHSITPITGGQRRVFVVELWEGEDVPVGIPRPDPELWEEHKEKRRPFLPPSEDEEVVSDEL